VLPSKRKTVLTVLLPAVLGLGAGLLTGPIQSRCAAAGKGARAAEQKPTAGLSLAEYKRLKPILDVKNQPWATIPWKYSITEARRLAAAARKPIFMVINTGNALGCT
jgi:hypothetical protein